MNSLIISRGQNPSNSLETLWYDTDTIKKCVNPVDWNPFPMDFWYSKQALNEVVATMGAKKTSVSSRMSPTSLTFALNRNKCVEYLREVQTKAADKFVRRAYLHWYEKFGFGEDMFETAFQNIQHLIDSYEMIS